MAKKRIIECSVNDEYVIGSGVPIGAAGSHDDVILRLAFGDAWIGLNIYATFRDSIGGNPTLVALLPTMLVSGEVMVYDVPIPAAAKLYDGSSMLTLTGYSIVDGTEEESATNTTTAFFRVLPSGFALADDGSITATLAQQLIEGMNEHVRETGELIEAHKAEVEAEIKEQNSAIESAMDIANSINEVAEDLRARADAGEFKGDSYVLTDDDKAEMVQAVIDGLPKYNGEVEDV